MMRSTVAGPVILHLVQHECTLTEPNPHETSLLPPEKQEVVAEWTRAGHYAGAMITKHSEQFPRYPSIPSRRVALEFAASQSYDLHLWLEDDAFVFDVRCDKWSEAIASKRVGAFRANPFGYINAAHYVSTREHDALLLQRLGRLSEWDLSVSMYVVRDGQKCLNLDAPRIEPAITRLAEGRVAKLDPRAAARCNPRKSIAIQELKTLLGRVCPADMYLLSLDFPDMSWQ